MAAIPKNGNARWQAGEVAKQNAAGSPKHSAIASHCQCRLNPSGCLVCRRWDRTIRGIDARRADSLRRQALGTLIKAGC